MAWLRTRGGGLVNAAFLKNIEFRWDEAAKSYDPPSAIDSDGLVHLIDDFETRGEAAEILAPVVPGSGAVLRYLGKDEDGAEEWDEVALIAWRLVPGDIPTPITCDDPGTSTFAVAVGADRERWYVPGCLVGAVTRDTAEAFLRGDYEARYR